LIKSGTREVNDGDGSDFVDEVIDLAQKRFANSDADSGWISMLLVAAARAFCFRADGNVDEAVFEKNVEYVKSIEDTRPNDKEWDALSDGEKVAWKLGRAHRDGKGLS
jgi:hypothetical protein